MMWHLGQSRSTRQAETRRKLADGQVPWWQRLRALLGWPCVIAAAFWAAATIIIVSGDERLPYTREMKLTRPVLARVGFERINDRRTEEQRKKAQQDVPDYFHLDQALVKAIQDEFRSLHAAVKAAENYEKYQETHGQRRPLDQATFDVFKTLTDEAGSEQFRRKVDSVAQRLARENMIEHADLDVDRAVRSTASHVMIDRGDGAFSAVPKERLTYASNSDHVRRLAEDLVQYLFVPAIKEAMVPIVEREIVPKEGEYHPIYVYDRQLTRTRIDEKLAALAPARDSYEPGDRLVRAGILDDEGLALLKAEHAEYLRKRSVDPELRSQWRKERLGLMGVLLLVTLGLSAYTVLTQPRVARKPARALAFALLLLVMLLADRFILGGVGFSPVWSMITITMTAAILTIAYSQRFAIGAATALALLTIVVTEEPLSVLVIHLSVASVVVLLLREVRTRWKMLEVGFITAAVAAVGMFFVGLAHQQEMAFILMQSGIAAVASMAGISIVLVLLPIIERAFRITTSLTLLEWADTSQPLLRQLIEKAPGTWQHSHLLGSMAETAAEEIGANGLLVRVGAYYHDVGKLCKPNYFIENQQAKMNAHRGLAPTMSLLVILTHVKDGLALARDHRLPPILHQFIAEHHGTTIVRYFHAMASQEAKASGQPEVSDTEFRYPGPKPHSRESAILMLCDGVEGAVRALQDPTPGRIETVVHEIAMSRLMDGQFDDCDITLRGLSRVEQSLVKSLRAIHHGRIAYPEKKSEIRSGVHLAQVRTA
ncbi:MAG: HDIG domain-containing protein [Phycisphaerae bacterium]|nr:HDIG domain-containing protein [Phycisphaerae bacterium]